MDNVYSYDDMANACVDCKNILEKMKELIDRFDDATDAYSANIKDKISVAAEKLVEELRAIIDSTKETVDKMNELMGESADGLATTEIAGEGDINDI